MRGVIGLHDSLQSGDILVGDRAFCSFAHLCLLSARGVFACCRLHQRRKINRLGVARWDKPQQRPVWMSVEQFATLPRWIEVRVLKHRVEQKGFRTSKVLLVATTLLDQSAMERCGCRGTVRQAAGRSKPASII